LNEGACPRFMCDLVNGCIPKSLVSAACAFACACVCCLCLFCCLLSVVCCLLSVVCCLLSAVCVYCQCQLTASAACVCCLLSVSAVNCLGLLSVSAVCVWPVRLLWPQTYTESGIHTGTDTPWLYLPAEEVSPWDAAHQPVCFFLDVMPQLTTMFVVLHV